MSDASMYLMNYYIPENLPKQIGHPVKYINIYIINTQDHLVSLHFSDNKHETSLNSLIRQQVFAEDFNII